MIARSMKKLFMLLLCAVLCFAAISIAASKTYAAADPATDYFSLTAKDSDVKVKLSKNLYYNKTIATPPALNYSFNKTNWSEFKIGTEYTIPVNQTMYLVATQQNGPFYVPTASQPSAVQFSLNGGSAYAGGNIMFLLDPAGQQTTVGDYCFARVFDSCANLKSAPKLPATTLGKSCYYKMFCNTGITEAPELPATVLAEKCYDAMFEGCTGLEKAPYLPAKNLVQGCYSGMFTGCSSLKEVAAEFTSWGIAGQSMTLSWLDGVASEGTIYLPSSLASMANSDNGQPSGWTRKDVSTYGKVARIADNYYGTLADALAAAKSGDTATLLSDVEIPDDIKAESLGGVTIDLGSFCVKHIPNTNPRIELSGASDSYLLIKGSALESGEYHSNDVIWSLQYAELEDLVFSANIGGENLVLNNVSNGRMFTASDATLRNCNLSSIEFGSGIKLYDSVVNYIDSESEIYNSTVEQLYMSSGTVFSGKFKNDPTDLLASGSEVSGPDASGYYIVAGATPGWNKGKFDYSAKITTTDGGWIVQIITPEGETATITSVVKGPYDSDVTSGFSGNTLTVAKSENYWIQGTGRCVYGDMYQISYTTDKSNSGVIRVNLRVVDDIRTAIDTTKLEDILVKAGNGAGTTNLAYNYTRTVELSNIITVNSIGGLDNDYGKAHMGLSSEVISSFKSAYSAAVSQFENPTSQADVIAAAEKLESELNALNADFQEDFIKFVSTDDEAQKSDGKTVAVTGWQNFDQMKVSYAKGVYKAKPANAAVLSSSKVTLANGVYTFFLTGKYAIFDLSKVYYVVVGQESGVTSADSLAQAVKDTVLSQVGASEQEVFTSATTDLNELIDMAFSYIASQAEPTEPCEPSEPSEEPIDKPTFSSYVTLSAKQDGTFEWSTKNGATILGMSYAVGIADADKETAMYYPIALGKSSAAALMSEAVHTFKAVVRVGSDVQVYYSSIKSSSCNTPAVVSLSSAIGVFSRNCAVEEVAYIKGVVADIAAAEASSEPVYFVETASNNGVMLDKTAFEPGDYTFFFFNANKEYVTQTIKID